MADFVAYELHGGREIAAAGGITFLAVESPGRMDSAPPTVTLVSPAPGTLISRSTPFVIDVTDDAEGVFACLFMRSRESRVYEVAWDGDAFSDLYARASARASVSGGWRFTLRREGGWPGAPAFTVRALDGNLV